MSCFDRIDVEISGDGISLKRTNTSQGTSVMVIPESAIFCEMETQFKAGPITLGVLYGYAPRTHLVLGVSVADSVEGLEFHICSEEECQVIIGYGEQGKYSSCFEGLANNFLDVNMRIT